MAIEASVTAGRSLVAGGLVEPTTGRSLRRVGLYAGLTVDDELPFEEWKEVLGSERITGATLDGLTHRSTIMETGTKSYRLRVARRRRSDRRRKERGRGAGVNAGGVGR